MRKLDGIHRIRGYQFQATGLAHGLRRDLLAGNSGIDFRVNVLEDTGTSGRKMRSSMDMAMDFWWISGNSIGMIFVELKCSKTRLDRCVESRSRKIQEVARERKTRKLGLSTSSKKFPEIGVPLVIIHFNGIFPHKNHAVWVPHGMTMETSENHPRNFWMLGTGTAPAKKQAFQPAKWSLNSHEAKIYTTFSDSCGNSFHPVYECLSPLKFNSVNVFPIDPLITQTFSSHLPNVYPLIIISPSFFQVTQPFAGFLKWWYP